MAVSVFKSTTRRATTPTTTLSDKETTRDQNPTSPRKKPNNSPLLTKKQPPRRSRSVSAVQRSNLEPNPTSTTPSTSSSWDFLVKRDNPLFWSTNTNLETITLSSSSSPPPEIETKSSLTMNPLTKVGATGGRVRDVGVVGGGGDSSRRGRSVVRNADSGKSVAANGGGVCGRRSISRVDTGRRSRSVSRGPSSRGHPVNSEPSSPTLSQKDGAFGSTFSEAEERTIKAVSEQIKSIRGDNLKGDTASHIYDTVRSEVRRAIADIQNDLESAIRRSNATAAIATANVTDIPPDLVNPSAVELVLDIRREYANKLEQSQERARKLRSDLAVEEHRGLELARILKEVLPDPQTPNVQKPRPGRKASIERRKMSKRLTEEAMAYFDECVSLSTFDSSDFSSQEDPPIKLVGDTYSELTPFSRPRAFATSNSDPPDNQELGVSRGGHMLQLSATSSNKEPTMDETNHRGRKFQFSPGDSFDIQQDMREYAKNFEKDIKKANINAQVATSKPFDLDEHNSRALVQSLLFDTVMLKNRIECGGMLLCGGGIAFSFSPFASTI